MHAIRARAGLTTATGAPSSAPPTRPTSPQAPVIPADVVETSAPPSPGPDLKTLRSVFSRPPSASYDVETLWVAPAVTSGNPVIGSDTVVVGSYDRGKVKAFDRRTGEERWSAELKDPSCPPAFSPDERLVFVGAGDERLHALDARTGEEVWSTTAMRGDVFTGDDGATYALANSLQRVDLDRRVVLQETPLKHYSEYAPVVGRDGTVYLGGDDGKLYALEPGTGNVKWACPSEGGEAVLGPDGTVYRGYLESALVALDPSSGREKWQFPTPVHIVALPVVGPDGTVYVGCDDACVYALDPSDGHQKWQFQAGDAIRVSPAPGRDGIVYVVSEDAVIHGLDQATGRQMWSVVAASHVDGLTVDDQGGFVFGCYDDNVYSMRCPHVLHEVQEQALAATAAGGTEASEPEGHQHKVETSDGWIVVDGVRLPRRGT